MNSISLNDLFDYDYKIYQDDRYFKFSVDSVLLAEFVLVKKNKNKLLDLCSGNFPVPMILDYKYNGMLDISAIEIQKCIFDLGIKSLEYNNIDRIKVYNEDIKNAPSIFKKEKFDIITCNPPYFEVNDEKVCNGDIVKAIARHEVKLKLEDIFDVSSKLIQNQGYLYMVHRAERLVDIINLSTKYNFGVKKIQMVYDNKDVKSCFILIEMIYNGKSYVKINPPLYLNEYSSYKGVFER